MSASMVPYGARAGFDLNATIREVAAHYELRARTLKYADGRRSERVAHARDALFWKLIDGAGLPAERAAELLKVNGKTAREAAKRHAHRIQEFKAQFKAPTQEADVNA